jgi:hypothetical protein
MMRSSTLPAPILERRRAAEPGAGFARGLMFVLAIAEEFRRAAAATHRYDQLKHAARARGEPAADIARRIYVEFYADISS